MVALIGTCGPRRQQVCGAPLLERADRVVPVDVVDGAVEQALLPEAPAVRARVLEPAEPPARMRDPDRRVSGNATAGRGDGVRELLPLVPLGVRRGLVNPRLVHEHDLPRPADLETQEARAQPVLLELVEPSEHLARRVRRILGPLGLIEPLAFAACDLVLVRLPVRRALVPAARVAHGLPEDELPLAVRLGLVLR